GVVRIQNYSSGFMLPTFVDQVLATQLLGTTAILTTTNEEVLQVTALLLQNGRPAHMISAQQGFHLRHLRELTAFTDIVCKNADKEFGFIHNRAWAEAKLDIEHQFQDSKNIDLVQRILRAFDREFNRKYKVEWMQFLSELRIEDFYFPEQEKILVSTMHKSKGKEFDNVFVYLDGYRPTTDERKRLLYVAMTRAKQHLEIHTNTTIFDAISVESLERQQRTAAKQPPRQIVLTCGLRDVNLALFQSDVVQETLPHLHAGTELRFDYNPSGLLYTHGKKAVCAFSKSFQTRLDAYMKKGYRIRRITVDYMVWWKSPDGGAPVLVVLPYVEMIRVMG
ncbi:MAG: 3'-5' exonuclease, partial [Bacteroidota bacterium]